MGFSETIRNGIADGIGRNQWPSMPVLCGTIHKGDPDDDGTNAATTIADTQVDRAQITSAAAVDGVESSTGDPATWVMEEGATLTHLGLHNAFSGGTFVGATELDQQATVAEGDTVSLLSFTIEVD